jgi:hypothetical protein
MKEWMDYINRQNMLWMVKWMNDWCFEPQFFTSYATLGWWQPMPVTYCGWNKPQIQAWSRDLLTSSPAHYHCVMVVAYYILGRVFWLQFHFFINILQHLDQYTHTGRQLQICWMSQKKVLICCDLSPTQLYSFRFSILCKP